MQEKLYKIPIIQYEEWSNPMSKGIETTNTFIAYTIHETEDGYSCYYGRSGRSKEFNSLQDCKDWIENVHYPAQVEKYFDVNTVMATISIPHDNC